MSFIDGFAGIRRRTFRKIVDHYGITIERARLICKSEEQFHLWPKFRQMLSVRAQNALLKRFAHDETIFDNPERLIMETDARELLRYKNVGKITVVEIVAALVSMGYRA